MATDHPSGPFVSRRAGDVSIVDFVDTSIIDSTKIEKIKTELESLADRMGHPKIVLSFDGVTHLASAMLGVLMSVNKKVTNMKGELRLTHLSPMIAEVVKITKLDKVLKIYPTTDKALEKF
jgi:anti-sigma B factor antagonist